jgi:hypothetical protein
MSEDLRQLRTGYDLHSQRCADDCETDAQDLMAAVNKIVAIKQTLASCPNMTLDDILKPELFGMLSTSEKIDTVKMTNHVLKQFKSMHAYCNTGNAHGGQASADGGLQKRTLTGHCYLGIDYELDCGKQQPSKKRTTLLEGTKWVRAMFSRVPSNVPLHLKTNRNATLSSPTLQNVNQLSSLLMELTKIKKVNPKLDLGCTELQIMQGIIVHVKEREIGFKRTSTLPLGTREIIFFITLIKNKLCHL